MLNKLTLCFILYIFININFVVSSIDKFNNIKFSKYIFFLNYILYNKKSKLFIYKKKGDRLIIKIRKKIQKHKNSQYEIITS